MIEESARVLSVDAGIATVSVQRRSACGSCSAKVGCGTALLASWLPQRRLTFQVENHVGARLGDMVVIGLDEQRLQRYAMVLYATPLAGLLVGAVTGQWLAGVIGTGPELTSVVFGLSGVLTALVWVRRGSTGLDSGKTGGVQLIRVSKPGIASSNSVLVELLTEAKIRQEKGN